MDNLWITCAQTVDKYRLIPDSAILVHTRLDLSPSYPPSYPQARASDSSLQDHLSRRHDSSALSGRFCVPLGMIPAPQTPHEPTRKGTGRHRKPRTKPRKTDKERDWCAPQTPHETPENRQGKGLVCPANPARTANPAVHTDPYSVWCTYKPLQCAVYIRTPTRAERETPNKMADT